MHTKQFVSNNIPTFFRANCLSTFYCSAADLMYLFYSTCLNTVSSILLIYFVFKFNIGLCFSFTAYAIANDSHNIVTSICSIVICSTPSLTVCIVDNILSNLAHLLVLEHNIWTLERFPLIWFKCYSNMELVC